MILKNCLFYKKNLLFYFTPLLLRSTPSIYLFYTLFYLNNIFFSHFFIISHLLTTPPNFNTRHSLFLFLWTPSLSFSHSPSFFPSSFFFFLLLLLLCFNLGMTMGGDFGFDFGWWFWADFFAIVSDDFGQISGKFLRCCYCYFFCIFFFFLFGIFFFYYYFCIFGFISYTGLIIFFFFRRGFDEFGIYI